MTDEQKIQKAKDDLEREMSLRSNPWQHPTPRKPFGRPIPEDKTTKVDPVEAAERVAARQATRADDHNPIFRPTMKESEGSV